MLSNEKLKLVDEFIEKMDIETSLFDGRIVKQIIINLFDEYSPGEIERDESGQVIFYTGIVNNDDE